MKQLRNALAGMLLTVIIGCSERQMQQGGSSMSPTIQPNELIRVNTSAYLKAGPSRWDVVVFHPTPVPNVAPEGIWAMRVIGLPGEVLEIREDGVYIDGDLQEMPEQIAPIRYLPMVPGFPAEVSYPFSIPGDSYFVVGDNTGNSYDSRSWGAVPIQSIIGKVKHK
jgi:signal peptidase I